MNASSSPPGSALRAIIAPYARADWRLPQGGSLHGQLNRVADRRRAAGDTRPDIAGYTTADLTLRWSGGRDRWEFAAAVRNLFDADAREPHSSVPVQIPNDLPLAGRSFYVQALRTF